MPEWTAGLPGLAAGYLVRTTAVLTLALAAAAMARRRPAAVRHFLLSSALVGLLLLPLFTLAPLEWRSPLVPAWMAAAGRGAGDGAAVEGTSRAGSLSPVSETAPGQGAGVGRVRDIAPVGGGIPGESTGAERPSGETRVPAEPASLVGKGIEGRAGAVRMEGPLSAGAEGQARNGARLGGAGSGVLGSILAILWAAGAMGFVLRLACGLRGAVRLSAEGTPLNTPAWRALLDRFLALFSLRREVRLRSHPKVLVPLTWGWRRPFVLLPEGTEAWSEDERTSALSHELSHIKRGDALVMLLVRVSLAAYWWNPLCWIVYRELLKEQEVACDELVLRAGIRPSTYAASLLAFRRSARLRWDPSGAWLGMLGRSSFQERVAAILKQKLVLMEVKMKTKIMLAAALGLAVALIGTARPAAAEGPAAPEAIEVAAAAMADGAVSPAALIATAEDAGQAAAGETQQEKAKAEEKAKADAKAKAAEEAAQEKAAAEKKIVFKTKEGGKSPLVITITEDGDVKTLVLEKPLTITRSKDGDALVLTIDGQDVQVLKGKPLRLEIKGGEVEVVHEPRLFKVGEGGAFKIVKEIGKEGEEGRTIVISGTKEPVVVGEKVKIVKEGETGAAWTITEGDKKGVWVAKAAPVKAGSAVWVGEGGQAYSVWGGDEGDMLKRIQALQEQVQAIKAKKMDLAALEDSLKKLEAELKAKEDKLKELELKFGKAPGEYTVVKRVGGDEAEGKVAVWVQEKDKTAREAKAATFIGVGEKGERTINLMLTGQEGEAGKAAYERALVTLKKELPEGYKIEGQEYDAEKGVMTFKISAPEGKKTDETLVRKLVESLKEAVKPGK